MEGGPAQGGDAREGVEGDDHGGGGYFLGGVVGVHGEGGVVGVCAEGWGGGGGLDGDGWEDGGDPGGDCWP